MKFVLAPDKFKGSLTGFEFCDAVEMGIRKVFPHATIIKKPLADGGDGTLDVVKEYLKASEVRVTVHDPLFRKIQICGHAPCQIDSGPSKNTQIRSRLWFETPYVNAIDPCKT